MMVLDPKWPLLSSPIKSSNLKSTGQLGETSCSLCFNGKDGSEKKRRNDESTNGCLKKKSTEKKEKTWNENTRESLRDEEDSSKTFRKTIFTRCKTTGRLDTMKR